MLTFSLSCFLHVVKVLDFSLADNNVTTKAIDFVDVLKQSLRRNNDDYAETQIRNATTSTGGSDALSRHGVPAFKANTSRVAGDSVSGAGRRAGDELTTETSTLNTEIFVDIKDSLQLRSDKQIPFKINLMKNMGRPNKPSVSSMIPNNIIKHKLPKSTDNERKKQKKRKRVDFKKFMSKNQGLLRQSPSKAIRTSRTIELDGQATRGELKKGVLRNVKEFEELLSLPEEEEKENDEGQLPPPEQLDMAPARGGRIHRLRIKGRLCHRHVLMPEGPKYDSSGRWYVPEHRLAARRPYDATPRPRLLLPRCCNCCKKSVLGCE